LAADRPGTQRSPDGLDAWYLQDVRSADEHESTVVELPAEFWLDESWIDDTRSERSDVWKWRLTRFIQLSTLLWLLALPIAIVALAAGAITEVELRTGTLWTVGLSCGLWVLAAVVYRWRT
jgi:hypothetical protein